MSRNTNAEPIRGPLSPERALWAAVFEVAIRDLCRADGDKDRRDKNAEKGQEARQRQFAAKGRPFQL